MNNYPGNLNNRSMSNNMRQQMYNNLNNNKMYYNNVNQNRIPNNQNIQQKTNTQINANILFYSTKCKMCMSLLRLLQNENLTNYFVMYCVDNNLSKLPPDLIVPTMRIKGINKCYVAEETFDWVKQAKFFRNYKKREFLLKQQEGLPGFSNLEDNSLSDKFAFKENDKPALPQNYVPSNSNGVAILTPPKEIDGEKIKESEQNNLIKKIEKLRETQDSGFSELAEKQRINAVLNNSNFS